METGMSHRLSRYVELSQRPLQFKGDFTDSEVRLSSVCTEVCDKADFRSSATLVELLSTLESSRRRAPRVLRNFETEISILNT